MAHELRNVTELSFNTQNIKLNLARHQIVKNCSFCDKLKLYLSVKKNASKWTILRWRCVVKMVLGIRFVNKIKQIIILKWIISRKKKRTNRKKKQVQIKNDAEPISPIIIFSPMQNALVKRYQNQLSGNCNMKSFVYTFWHGKMYTEKKVNFFLLFLFP